MSKKILILGSNGMLGQELVKAHDEASLYEVTAWDREDIDVTNHDDLKKKITDLWPDVIYNAVAYNAVDLCEESNEEKEKAECLNVTYPGNLATLTKTMQATLVHYSTDYVFDGERPTRRENVEGVECCDSGCRGCMYDGAEDTIEHFVYAEGDLPRPLSVYGQSKYDGERAVEKNTRDFYIIRLSKLFGQPASSEAGKRVSLM